MYCYVASRKIALNTIVIVADNQIGLAKLKNRIHRLDPLHDILDAISLKLYLMHTYCFPVQLHAFDQMNAVQLG